MDRAHLTDMRWARVMTWSTAWLNQNRRARTVLWVIYGLMCLFLAGYLASLTIRGSDHWPLFGEWSVGAFEVVASVLCLARGLTRRSGRAVALTLGFGLLLWPEADLRFEAAQDGASVPPAGRERGGAAP